MNLTPLGRGDVHRRLRMQGVSLPRMRVLKAARSPSGRRFRRLFGLARLGADGLARRRRSDHGRPARRPHRSLAGLGIRPELRTAGRRELGFPGDHAGGHAIDVGDLGTAEPERVGGTGLLLLGRVALAGGRHGRNHQRYTQQPSKLGMPCSKNHHPSSPVKVGRNCG